MFQFEFIPIVKSVDEVLTYEGLEKMFNSSAFTMPRQSFYIGDVLRGLQKGWIQCEPFEENGKVFQIPDEVKTKLRPAAMGGGEDHVELKIAAWLWAVNQGEDLPLFEKTTASGSRPDVICPNLKYWIECGDTSPDKMVEAFKHGYKAFILFPFTIRPYFEAYRFTMLNREFIDEIERRFWANHPTKGLW